MDLSTAIIQTSCEELTHWKRLWCWEGLGARGEGDDRGWDGWMASPTQWTWISVNSRSWWWTGRPGVLRFMGLQRVRHYWATKLNWYSFRINCQNFFQSDGIILNTHLHYIKHGKALIASYPYHYLMLSASSVLAILMGGVKVFLCGFYLHFFNNCWYWVLFHLYIGHLYIFFMKWLFKNLPTEISLATL